MSDIISFDEENHKYIHKPSNKEFISCTTLLGKYQKPFESDLHARHVADREGFTKEQVLQKWEFENKKACDKGNATHKLLEIYLTENRTINGAQWLYDAYDNAAKKDIGKVKELFSETILYDEDYCVAGMADLIFNHNKNEFTIADFKTNKKYDFHSNYNEWFLKPLEHLQVCKFNLYGLQLSMYAYFYEKMTNTKCRSLINFYIKDKQFFCYHTNYLKSDIEKLLKHWKTKTKGLN